LRLLSRLLRWWRLRGAVFPDTLNTPEDLEAARRLIELGYRHRLKVDGSREFKDRIMETLKLIEEAGYGDLLHAYIRRIVEVEGYTQLREVEATLWMSKFSLTDVVDAASIIIQKVYQMKRFLEGKPYYGPKGEMWTTKKRFEFLEKLKEKAKEEWVRRRCKELLKEWEAPLVI